jgi:DNA polymerase-4
MVEPASIDDAYLDVSGLDALIDPPQIIGARIKGVSPCCATTSCKTGISD